MSSLSQKTTRAWVVRWDWCGAHAAVDQALVAVLRPQIQGAALKRIVEVLYASHAYAPVDMLQAIRRNGHNPCPAQWGTVEVEFEDGRRGRVEWSGEVTCGDNPFLVARLARVWSLGDASGRIQWEDDPPGRPIHLSSKTARGG